MLLCTGIIIITSYHDGLVIFQTPVSRYPPASPQPPCTRACAEQGRCPVSAARRPATNPCAFQRHQPDPVNDAPCSLFLFGRPAQRGPYGPRTPAQRPSPSNVAQ